MATWVRNNTGTLPSATDANVVGDIALTNGTAPPDFDPTAVLSARIQWTLAITAGTQVDDTYAAQGSCTLRASGGTLLAQANDPGGNQNLTAGAPSASFDGTDTTGLTGFSTAQWESGFAQGLLPDWLTYSGSKMADGVTVAVTAVTVTITYTPIAGYDPLGRRQVQRLVHRM